MIPPRTGAPSARVWFAGGVGFQAGVIEAVRDWGLPVVEHVGWQTRGDDFFDPKGHVLHHDVASHTETLPNSMIVGRADNPATADDEFLPGPLCNFWLARSGTVHLVAAGEANHAGVGGFNGLSGNHSVWGTEMNNLGHPTDPWPDAQLDAMARLAAATADFSGFTAATVCGHKNGARATSLTRTPSTWLPSAGRWQP